MDEQEREEIEWAERMEREQALRGNRLWDAANRKGDV